MRIIEYTPQSFDLLHAAALRTASRNLRNRDFVNHYYASVPWCRLYLLMSADNTVLGLLGIEQMPFGYGGRKLKVGFGTNYHSLQPGNGGFLFRHWMKSCDMGISFGGSADAHKLIHSQHWSYFQGVQIYLLNKNYTVYEGQPAWKRAAKWIARHSTRRNIGA